MYLLLLSIDTARLRGALPPFPPSGLIIHQELFPVPSFCTLTKRLWSDKLCRIEFCGKGRKQNVKTSSPLVLPPKSQSQNQHHMKTAIWIKTLGPPGHQHGFLGWWIQEGWSAAAAKQAPCLCQLCIPGAHPYIPVSCTRRKGLSHSSIPASKELEVSPLLWTQDKPPYYQQSCHQSIKIKTAKTKQKSDNIPASVRC